jgi:hypothetical protein
MASWCKFESRDVHLAYEAHPDHVRAGGIMVAEQPRRA